MKKLLGIMVLSLLLSGNAFSETIFYKCVGQTSDEFVVHGLDFNKLKMTHWNDQKVDYPIIYTKNNYVWVEERDDLGGMFPNSRIINYFNKSKNTLDKLFYGISYKERDNLRLLIHDGKGTHWNEDGPKFIKYQIKILKENFKPQFTFNLNCNK